MPVDSKLHDPGSPADREPDSGNKRALRGAAGGIYVGPATITAADTNTAHATTENPGGLDGSTGYRKRNGYYADNDATGAGTAGAAFTVRRTGRRAYRGDGTFGGSIPGYPAQRPTQRAAAATGTGEYLTAAGSAAAFIDRRGSVVGDGGVQLGGAGRGTSYKQGTADPVGIGGVTAGVVKNGRVTAARGYGNAAALIPRPVLGTAANPSAGTVALVQAALKLQADLHADDITGGANGLAGCEILLYARGTDTDEDSPTPIAKVDFDSTTLADAFTGLAAATTYAFYARFKDAAGNVGPLSDRGTVATS